MPEVSGIYYKEEGKGLPVLLLHGFCESHEIWNSISKKLASRYRVLSIDLPGFGKSPMLAEPFSIADVGEKVLEWLHAIQVPPCVVIGHSLGGYVTLAMVDQQAHSFSAFGLFHSTAVADSEEKKVSRNKVIEFVTKHGVAPFIESFIPPLFYDQKNPSVANVVKLALTTRLEALVAYVKAMRDRQDRTEVVKKFSGPVLLISGEKDTGISPESMEKQAKMTLNSTFFVMQDVGHMGMFENEELALDHILEFLSLKCR